MDATPSPGPRRGADTLGLDEATMRRLAHHVADLVVDALVHRAEIGRAHV